MKNENPKIKLNNITNRILPISESVKKGLEPESNIDDFKILKILGKGTYGKVFLSEHKITKAKYAIKLIDKMNNQNIEGKSYISREIEIMYKLHHPNCIKLYNHFEDENYCYFIIEYLQNGNLYDLIKNSPKKILPSDKVSNIIKQLTSAIYYLHNMNPPIIHRDIKPENILLDNNNIIKLTDFGLSNYINLSEIRNTYCGTPLYLAPEMIIGNGHDYKVDIWGIGVIIFELLTGRMPFLGNDQNSLMRNIINGVISWDNNIDVDARDLISKILIVDPNLRISLEDIMKHNFIRKFCGNCDLDLVKPCNFDFYEPYIISKYTPNIYMEKIKENEKKLKEENEKKLKEENEKKLKEENEINDEIVLIGKSKTYNNTDLMKLELKSMKKENDNLFKLFTISQYQNNKHLEALESNNVIIYRLENQNFILEDGLREKEKIIEEKNNEILKLKKEIAEKFELLKQINEFMEKQENKNSNKKTKKKTISESVK